MTLVIVHEDLVNEMWAEYLKNVDGYDKRLTDGWKDDANGILVFVSLHLLVPVFIAVTVWETGLFSAVVASFIIESYKLLSPDPASQSVFLLGQLSQQFAGFANGTYVQPQSYPSSPPSTSIICVNILWLLSLLLSTTSALFATLMLQWARVYLDLPQIPSVPRERARVRSVLFFGMEKYRMRLAVETAPTLLHLSVFLFFIGLVVFFFTIFKTVAVVVLIAVGFFGLAYLALTILPCLDRSCPYRTPMSSPWWYLWHTSLSGVAQYLHFILRQLHNCLVPLNLGEITTRRQRLLTQWLQTIEDFAEKHGKRLKHGFRGTVVECAREASQDIDVKALTWLFQLPALTEKSKIQKFVASLPGETIIQLLSKSFQDGKVTFRHHLSTLFRSCTPGTASSGLDENMRRRRLLVCLNAVHHIAKASIAFPPSSRLLNEMRLHFANIALMRPLWVDRDPAIRVTARSICALFARQLLRQRQLGEGELSWLQEVMDKPSHTIFNEHNNRARVDSMNVDAFVDGVLSYQRDDLPNVLAISFKDTLMVLMNTNSRASVHTDTFEEWLSYHIRRRIEQDNDPGRDNVVDQLRRMSSTSTTGISSPQSQSQSQSPVSGT
jgi:Family of unknown function (DUF6535)